MTSDVSGSGLRFGIAGWSYDDWNGVVYPRGCRDKLRFCAQHVDMIEINSSFYHVPAARTTQSWAQRVADLPGFFFTAKLPQQITHGRELDGAMVAQVHEGFEPLQASGCLRMLLAQFSYRFDFTPDHAAWLFRIRDAFRDIAPLAVEVRHGSWAADEATATLHDLDCSVANLDYPGAQSGFGPRVTGMNGPSETAYFRLHGRNSNAWFDRRAGRDEVYDYEYSDGEVSDIARRCTEIGQGSEVTIVVANNHYQGKELKLAVQLLAWYRQQRVKVPEPLVRTYPQLSKIAIGQGELFS